MSLSLTEYNNICASVGHYLPEKTGDFADALDAMLSLAESEFGQRDKTFTIWNVEFTRSHPMVYGLRFGAKVVTIILSRGCLALARKGELRNAFWELSHECVHLLSPPTSKGPIVLEEGVACWFQRLYMRENFDFERPQTMACYASAEAKFEKLRELDQDIVWKMRQEEPVFRHITPSLMLRYCPSAPEELVEALTKSFDRDANIEPLDAPVPRPAPLVLMPTDFRAWRRGGSHHEQD